MLGEELLTEDERGQVVAQQLRGLARQSFELEVMREANGDDLDEPVPGGGGETYAEKQRRLESAYERLSARFSEGQAVNGG